MLIRCSECGREFERIPSHVARPQLHHYCSLECKYRGYSRARRTRVRLECPICGEVFERKPSQITRAKIPACSTRCAAIMRAMVYQGQRTGENSPNWKGGRTEHHGYVLARAPWHPFAGSTGYVPEHRLMMEDHLGRFLWPWEVVHHVNGNRADNRIENLQLMTAGEHAALHRHLEAQRRRNHRARRAVKAGQLPLFALE